MSAYVLPNIILFVAIVGLLGMIARHMPEAQRRLASGAGNAAGPSRQRLWLLFLGRLRGAWRFILEAKGLHDPAGARLRMKQLLVQNQRKVRAKQQAVKITAQGQARAALPRHTTPKLAKAENEALASRENVGSDAASDSERPIAPEEKAVPIPPQPQPLIVSQESQAESSMALAKQYLDNRQFFEARKLLQSMDQTMHQSPVYWARLGYAQYHLGGYGEAVRCYERSLQLDDQQPNRHYNLALAYQAAGNKSRALTSLDKALKLDPDNAKYIETKQGLSA